VIKYAVFLEPEGELRDFILDLKSKVDAVLPCQPYCSHPPHSTLIFTWFKDLAAVKDALEQALSGQSSFEIMVEENILFKDDVMADYGHTFALKVKAEPRLFALQQRVAEALEPLIDLEPAPKASGFLENEPFASSFRKYGFPFVGNHWIPHFSVASLQVSEDDALLGELMDRDFSFKFRLARISLVEVNDDRHTKLHEYNINN